MARPSKTQRSDISELIVRLRKSVGDTQQQFAARLGTAITTIARYETSRPPSGMVLNKFINLALSLEQDEIAELLSRSFIRTLENAHFSAQAVQTSKL